MSHYLTTFRGEVMVHDAEAGATLATVPTAEACRRILTHDALLAALKGFLHADPDVFRDELAAARAAIANAEGRP